jgi:hypothetical protein
MRKLCAACGWILQSGETACPKCKRRAERARFYDAGTGVSLEQRLVKAGKQKTAAEVVAERLRWRADTNR